MINKKHSIAILAAVAAMLAWCPVQAQSGNAKDQDIAVYYNMGIGSLPYSGAIEWHNSPIVAFGVGADYNYWLNDHYGLSAGLRFTYISGHQTSDPVSQTFNAQMNVKGFGVTDVTLHGTASAIDEERVAAFIELPIKAYYRWDNGLYGSLGLSLSKAISNRVVEHAYPDPSFSITSIPALGISLPTPVPTGIDPDHVKTAPAPANFKPFFCLLNAEFGYKHAYNGDNAISVGIFGRCALGKYKVDTGSDLFSYANSQVYVNRSASSLVDRIGYYELGLKVALHFGLCSK